MKMQLALICPVFKHLKLRVLGKAEGAADLSEVACSSSMYGGIPSRRGPSRVACPAEEGCEGALAAAKESSAPPLLWRGPAIAAAACLPSLACAKAVACTVVLLPTGGLQYAERQ